MVGTLSCVLVGKGKKGWLKNQPIQYLDVHFYCLFNLRNQDVFICCMGAGRLARTDLD